ncbi:hypothetical protein CIPAW_16G059400 [Carya illinoinensis]|uniref:Uncharacterized protein n=1 Tax=Carya illinoinensis TaxID=32201 RepID=A0A8T1N6R3_CARIL|nr:hypothetical protein CIPAW_16G059400 [Carya illinoinensis]
MVPLCTGDVQSKVIEGTKVDAMHTTRSLVL